MGFNQALPLRRARSMRSILVGLTLVGSVGALTPNARAQRCLVDERAILSGGVGRDGIPALTTPSVTSVVQGDQFLDPRDLILGVVVDGEARAYPHGVLWWHEIINDTLGGRPIVVSFCPLTGSGLVHDPELEPGELFNFGVSGLLFDNNLILFDRTTETLWSQMRVQAICGPRTGEPLELLPVVQATWESWKALHPDTTVVSFETGFNRNYTRYPYGDYDLPDNDQLLFPQDAIDRRLAPKEFVLGLTDGELARAYPESVLSSLGENIVINDELGERPIVIAHHAAGRMTIPFERLLRSPGEDSATGPGGSSEDAEGQVLTFEIVLSEGESLFSMRDRETGSRWNLNGEAVDGPLVGRRLSKVATFTSFWFAWSTFHRGSEIYRPATSE